MKTTAAAALALTLQSLGPAAAQQRGKASYYSKSMTGARTSSGERLHHDSMTCAHKTYPFGTLLEVTNLGNGKKVVVRVTDRGPFTRGRVVDLSWGAAKAIGMLAKGVVPVEVKPYRGTHIPLRDDTPEGVAEFSFEVPSLTDSLTDWRFNFREKAETGNKAAPKGKKAPHATKHKAAQKGTER